MVVRTQKYLVQLDWFHKKGWNLFVICPGVQKNDPIVLDWRNNWNKMMKNRAVILLSALIVYLSINHVSGEIDCHYCGIRKLCTLPYDEEFAEKITCKKSCMKFDGNADDGKRVLVRSCGVEDTNICNKTTNWHGSKGEKCICNAENCNSAMSNYFTLKEIIQNITSSFLIICVFICKHP